MSNCININHHEVIEMAESLGKNPEIIAAAFGVWQQENNSFDRFPTEEETLDILMPSQKSESVSIGKRTQDKIAQVLKDAKKKAEYDEESKSFKVNGKKMSRTVTQKIDAMPEYSFDGPNDDGLEDIAQFGTDVHKVFEDIVAGKEYSTTSKAMKTIKDSSLFNNIWNEMNNLYKQLSLEGKVLSEVMAVSFEDRTIMRIDIPVVAPDGSVDIYDIKVTDKSYNKGDSGREYRSEFGVKKSKYDKHKTQVVSYAATLEKGVPELGIPPLRIRNIGIIPVFKHKNTDGKITDIIVEPFVMHNYYASKHMAAKVVTLSDKDMKKLEDSEKKALEEEAGISFEVFASTNSRATRNFDFHEMTQKLNEVEKRLAEEEDLPKSEEKALIKEQQKIKSEFDRVREMYDEYVEDLKEANKILHHSNLAEMSESELVDSYNLLVRLDPDASILALNRVKKELGFRLFNKREKELQEKAPDIYNKNIARTKDLTGREVMMKTITHMTEAFPELQELAHRYNEAYFEMEQKREALKAEGLDLFKKVISEYNKKFGIVEKVKQFFVPDNAKYLDWLVDKDGNYIGEQEAKKLTENQKNFRKWAMKVNKEFIDIMSSDEMEFTNYTAIKMDPKLIETYREKGFVDMIAAKLGSNFSLDSVIIEHENGAGGKEMNSYKNIRESILQEGKGSLAKKIIAVAKLVKYNIRARRQLKKGINQDGTPLISKDSGEFRIENGKLTSKFMRPTKSGKSYSKDYFSAIYSFIDDMTHIKYMEPLVPHVESVMHLNSITDDGRSEKKNVVKYMQDWKQMKIEKTEKEGDPLIDSVMKFLRKVTSWTVMAFNYPAGIANLMMGHYNNWRAEGTKLWALGNARMFMNKKGGRSGYIFNRYAIDLLKKYKAISVDFDHNPQVSAGNIFDGLAHWMTKKGELSIQGSMVLGLMDEKEFNSFEYKDGILVVKEGNPISEKELEKRILAYKDRVSDIQGKYSEKDRRNFMNTEWGRFISQFRVWIPDWWKERFGEKYVGYDNQIREGSARAAWQKLSKEGFDEMKQQVMSKKFWTDPKATKNLRGMLFLATLLVLKNANDDDDEKRKQSDTLSKYISDVLFIFNPKQAEYMLQTPAAGLKTLTNFIKVFEHAWNMEEGFLEEYKGKSKYGEEGDYKIVDDFTKLLPANKLYRNDLFFPED